MYALQANGKMTATFRCPAIEMNPPLARRAYITPARGCPTTPATINDEPANNIRGDMYFGIYFVLQGSSSVTASVYIQGVIRNVESMTD